MLFNYEPETVVNGLCTTKYTVVKCENEIDRKYNAPCHFAVENVETGYKLAEVNFQEGPIKECGINGVNNEDLILMVLTRLEAFQNTEFECRENAMAITKLEEALMWLRKRTNDRAARNVEGTSKI